MCKVNVISPPVRCASYCLRCRQARHVVHSNDWALCKCNVWPHLLNTPILGLLGGSARYGILYPTEIA